MTEHSALGVAREDNVLRCRLVDLINRHADGQHMVGQIARRSARLITRVAEVDDPDVEALAVQTLHG